MIHIFTACDILFILFFPCYFSVRGWTPDFIAPKSWRVVNICRNYFIWFESWEFLTVRNKLIKWFLFGRLICFYCEKKFKDRYVLKEHMRKKQHKQINPKDKNYDRFYVINYLVNTDPLFKLRKKNVCRKDMDNWKKLKHLVYISIDFNYFVCISSIRSP